MRLPSLVALAFAVLIPSLATATPVDLEPVSAAQVQHQLHALARTLETYHPSLKSASARMRFDARVRQMASHDPGVEGLAAATDPAARPRRPAHHVLPDPARASRASGQDDWVSDGILAPPWNPMPGGESFPAHSQLVRLGPYGPEALLAMEESMHAGPASWVEAPKVWAGYAMYWLGVVGPGGKVAMTVRTPT